MSVVDILKSHLEHPTDTNPDFDEVASQVPAEALGSGIADADRTAVSGLGTHIDPHRGLSGRREFQPAGAQRCGSSSSISLARCVGSRSRTSLR